MKANDFGVEKLFKKLVAFTDTLSICIQNKPNFEDAKYNDNAHAKAAFDGIETTRYQFLEIVKEFKLAEFKPELGDQFDPMKHDAIFQVDSPPGLNLSPNKIGVVVKSGWLHGETLIRPATVGVVRS